MRIENQPESAGPPSSINAAAADRRLHPRYTCDGRAEVFVPQGALLFQGRILDLSHSGCFIEASSLKLERGTHVEVAFVARRMRFRIAGYIAALRPGRGAGIAFHVLSPRRARLIADLIRELSEVSG